tara:strand:+ start:654 stop:3119 length:2466 start_codon:yes stop_codon:yes gene_type:complete
MSIKIIGDNMQYGDTAIATLSTDALTLQSGTSLNAQKLTASNGIEITNHMTAENGVVTVTGQLTASNGIFVTNGAAFTQADGGDAQFAVGIDAFFTKGLSVNSGVGQTVHLNAPITSHLTPSTDGTKDLGTSALQWGEAHVDHGHIDDITSTGTSNLATVNVTGKLTASNGIAVTGDVSFDDANFSGDVTLGSAATDITTVTGQLTASNGMEITNHMTADNGVVNVTGQLTASNGIKAVGGSRFGNYGVSDSTLDVYAKSIFYEHLTASNGLHITNGELVNSEESRFYGEVRMLAAVTASNGMYITNEPLLSAAPVDFRNDVALGYYAGNTITVPGRFGSDLLPITDSAHDLGSSTRQWEEAHVDHGHIDDITSTGTSNLAIVNVTGKLTASNGIAVTGESTFSGDVLPGAVTNTLGDGSNQWAYLYSKGAEFDDANATINMPDAFVVSKSANSTTISTKLTASNGISLTNHLTADNGVVTVSGQLTASNGLTVNGNVNFDDAAFSGDVSLGDGRTDVITVNGVATFTNVATFADQLSASNGIAVTGDATFEKGTFSDTLVAANHFTASNGLRANGSAMFGAEVQVAGEFSATSVATFSGQLTASNGISISGNANVTDLTVSNKLTASNGMTVIGDASFQDAVFRDIDAIGDVTLGNASSDVTTITGQLTASNGARIVGDVGLAGITTITGQLTASQGASITGDVLLGENDTIKAGVYITYSDATLKENIEVISNPIDKVMSMRGVTYNLKSSSGNPEVGFLAQEMKQAVPEVVYGNGDGNLGIDYAKLTSVLVEAIKTQQTQIREQQSQIDELKECMLKK